MTNRGGEIVSLKLKKHKDKDGEVDLLVPGENGAQGLALTFGGTDVPPVTDLMDATMLNDTTIVFTRTFIAYVRRQNRARSLHPEEDLYFPQ